jgi:hypothetical protein
MCCWNSFLNTLCDRLPRSVLKLVARLLFLIGARCCSLEYLAFGYQALFSSHCQKFVYWAWQFWRGERSTWLNISTFFIFFPGASINVHGAAKLSWNWWQIERSAEPDKIGRRCLYRAVIKCQTTNTKAIPWLKITKEKFIFKVWGKTLHTRI